MLIANPGMENNLDRPTRLWPGKRPRGRWSPIYPRARHANSSVAANPTCGATERAEESAAPARRRGEMGNDAERVRRLVPGEDKIDNVHEKGGPKRRLDQVAQGTSPPGAKRRPIRWLLRDTAPTQAQSKGHKDEEQ